jgi:hypothetical protein
MKTSVSYPYAVTPVTTSLASSFKGSSKNIAGSFVDLKGNTPSQTLFPNTKTNKMKTISTHVKALVGVLLLVLTTAFADAQSITINSVASSTACQGTTVSLTFTTKNGNGTNEKFFDQQDAANAGYPATSFYSVFTNGSTTFTSAPFNLSNVDFPTPSNATKTITYLVPVPLTVTPGTYTMTLISQYPSVTASVGGVLINVTTNSMAATMTSMNMGVCQNAAQPTLTFNGSGQVGGTYTFYYTINGVANQVSSASGTATVSVPTATAGTFTYTLTGVSNDINTCGITAASGTSVISVNPPPSGSISASNGLALNCTVPSTVLTAPAGTAYMWSNNAGTQSITVSSAGTWSVTVWNGGCSADFSATTTSDKNPPTGSISNDNGLALNCTIPSTTLTAPAGASYMWSNGSTASSITVSTAGTWSVTVTGSNGCKADFSATTTADKNPPSGSIGASNGLALNCTVPSTVLTAPSGASYLWSDNSTAATLTVSAAGTFSVTVTGANGCTADFSATSTSDKNPPSGSITNNNGLALNCSVTSTTLTAPAGASYLWSDNSTASTLTVSTAGTWSVTVTGANGCTADFSATTSLNNTPPTAGITNNTGSTEINCTYPSISVTATGGASYAWTGGLGTSANASITAPGTYTVTVTGSNGCSSEAAITITQNTTAPTAGITNNTGTTVLTCNTPAISVTATGGASYVWSGGLGNSASASITAAGTYSVTVSNANGCSADASISVSSAPLPTASISAPAAVCASTPAATLTFAVTGSGTITVTYSDGSSNHTVAGTGTSLSVNVAPSATTTYSIVSVTDANGCVNTASSSATIQVNACAATFTIDAVQPTCFGATNGKIVITNISGGTAPFQISKDNGFSWTPVSNPALFEFLNLGAGVYNIYLKHNDGQIQPMSTTTLVNPARINANIGVTGSLTCSNGSVTLNVANIYGGGGAPYSLSVDNGAFSSNTSFQVGAGTHTVTAQDKNGCAMVVGTVVVAGVDPIVLNAPAIGNVTTFGGSNGSVTVSAKGGSGSYMYTLTKPGGNNTVLNAGTASVTFTGLIAGSYTIAAVDNNGCGTASRTFVVNQPLAAAVPADLVLGSESETNVFPALKTVSMVYNVSNTSNDNAAFGVVLRITKPTPGYKVELMSTASYTNPLGTTYTLDNSRWTKTADNDMFVEFTLSNDPSSQNYMPAKTFIPKRIGILVTRPASAMGKGEFTLTGIVRANLPDNFGQDNSTVHQFFAQ